MLSLLLLLLIIVLLQDRHGCVGPALPGTDLRGGGNRDIQDMSGVLECSGV